MGIAGKIEKRIRFLFSRGLLPAVLTFALLLLGGCSAADQEPEVQRTEEESAKLQIGMSFDSFVIERWLRDRDFFVMTAQDLGAEVNVQVANGDVQEQIHALREKLRAPLVPI